MARAKANRTGKDVDDAGTATWFPAKRYGWGWGFPASWQGWMVIALYALLAAAGAIVIVPTDRPGAFVAYMLVLGALLTLFAGSRRATAMALGQAGRTQ
jgi:hypothetical protein